ncbi:hypothetical protein BD410DRAFT_804452 [Rickenella mellea]|uniref:Uncharacterized protein n=1 Tax=Rickenella mellea TaxID=50990 RepID=A0A4Y7Q2A7_9AGAM|nr:hypothetical protein BD410DRAFT_804452 [Rickenella mellea]
MKAWDSVVIPQSIGGLLELLPHEKRCLIRAASAEEGRASRTLFDRHRDGGSWNNARLAAINMIVVERKYGPFGVHDGSIETPDRIPVYCDIYVTRHVELSHFFGSHQCTASYTLKGYQRWEDVESTSAGHSKLNLAGVDNLMRLLTRVKSDGFQRACAGELWDDVPKPFDQAVTPFLLENGIKTMPDEVLSLVFEAGHRMTDGWEFGKLVSISGAYPASQIQAFLSRSAQMDLKISRRPPHEFLEAALDDLFQTLRSSSHRWSHLDLFDDFADVSMQKLDLCDVPRLISMNSGQKWRLPMANINMVKGVNRLYANGAPITKFESQLTSFELLVKDVNLNVDDLASTLHSMPNLTHLSLEIDSCEAILFSTIRRGRDTREPHSVHIETLRISIKNPTTSYVVAELYDALRYFSASTIEITLSCLTNTNLSTFFYGHGGVFFPYGSTISITLLGTGDEDSWDQKIYLLWEIVENCEIAHTIHIDNLDAPLVPCAPLETWHDFSHYWKDFCNLRHLTVRHCSKFTEPVLKGLVSNLMTGEPSHSFQSLDIIACPHISEELFLNLRDEVGPRINWKPDR